MIALFAGCWLGLALPFTAPSDELSRLEGQAVRITATGYAIDDIAGEGPPRVGVIERRGEVLVLMTSDGQWRLAGPLAVPRIAGPGYKVWVIGELDGTTLRARRLGVLAPPSR